VYLIIASDATCPIADPLAECRSDCAPWTVGAARSHSGNHLGTAELWMTVSTKRPLRQHRTPTASPLAVSFQTPELDLQVAIGQLSSQETEQRTEQPGLFQ
jgi:hypothetical protein